MRVDVKLYGYLKKYRIDDRGHIEITVSPETTVRDIQEMLAIPGVYLEFRINGQRARQEDYLNEGDALDLLPLIIGG